MKTTTTRTLALAGILCAVAVVGSLFSFPVLGSKCSPVQHMVNILCAVLLGPGYGLGAAFGAALIMATFKILARAISHTLTPAYWSAIDYLFDLVMNLVGGYFLMLLVLRYLDQKDV